jgi:hypothetical protein
MLFTNDSVLRSQTVRSVDLQFGVGKVMGGASSSSFGSSCDSPTVESRATSTVEITLPDSPVVSANRINCVSLTGEQVHQVCTLPQGEEEARQACPSPQGEEEIQQACPLPQREEGEASKRILVVDNSLSSTRL